MIFLIVYTLGACGVVTSTVYLASRFPRPFRFLARAFPILVIRERLDETHREDTLNNEQ
jgi:hypothetical protein